MSWLLVLFAWVALVHDVAIEAARSIVETLHEEEWE